MFPQESIPERIGAYRILRRLVAPGRRGFQWVKWVVRIELTDAPDTGAAASTVWSSFTRAGRGAA